MQSSLHDRVEWENRLHAPGKGMVEETNSYVKLNGGASHKDARQVDCPHEKFRQPRNRRGEKNDGDGLRDHIYPICYENGSKVV
ncbi:hypothetical protein NC653_029984 [Populus alba x Populus x berolinensis]|uniref:Uncharacterized protein n=1 Tax=Populus alba x Populus x berolinensis TaxID=444605 RepID=A0AAD6M664_9ROSI|nr:hypothetical protein NC653_029984 [Populus alba x Populus x berolinensis]